MEMALRETEQERPEPPRIARLTYAVQRRKRCVWSVRSSGPSAGCGNQAEAGMCVLVRYGTEAGIASWRNLATLTQLWDRPTA